MWLQLLTTLGYSGLFSLNKWDNFVPIQKVNGDGEPELFTGIPYMIFPETHGGKDAMMLGYDDEDDDFTLATELDRFKWNLYEPNGKFADLAQFVIIPRNNSCYSVANLCPYFDHDTYNTSEAFYPNLLDIFLPRRTMEAPEITSTSIFSSRPLACIQFSSTKPGSVITKIGPTYFLTATASRNMQLVDKVLDSAQMKWRPVVTPGKARIVNMKYEEDEDKVNDCSVPLTMSKRTYINNSSVTQTHVFKVTHKQVDTHSFTLSSSFKIFASVSVEGNIPLLGSLTVETGFEAEFGSSTSFSTEVTREFSVEEPLVVPPKTKVTAIATLTVVEGVTLPVTVTLRATLEVRRLEEISEGKYKKVRKPASGDFVKAYLQSEKVDGRIISVDGNVVTMETVAEVKATYGIHSFVSVNEENL